jgi:hypothetical protein
VDFILAMLLAESTLYPFAERFGKYTSRAQEAIRGGCWGDLQTIIDYAWYDVSFGLSQVTVALAASYGIGNGTPQVDNVMLVRKKLFNREVSIDVGTRHLKACYENDRLQALIRYNSGSYQPEGNWYWQDYKANIDRYRWALSEAPILLEGQI